MGTSDFYGEKGRTGIPVQLYQKNYKPALKKTFLLKRPVKRWSVANSDNTFREVTSDLSFYSTVQLKSDVTAPGCVVRVSYRSPIFLDFLISQHMGRYRGPKIARSHRLWGP
jgi:hypothetical protein